MKVSVIIPAYNEKNNVVSLAGDIINKIENVEVIIVDDSKEDNISPLLEKMSKVKYIFRGKKLGRGSAVIEGIKYLIKNTDTKIFVEMDADFSHKPEELKNNIIKFKKMNLDLLIASRYLKNSKIYNWSIQRRIFSFMANVLAEILLNVGVTDYTNGYRIYSKRALKIVISKCGKIGDGFIVLSEFLLQLKLHNYKISETSSIFVNRARGESSVNLSLILQSLLGLLKLYYIKLKANNNIKKKL